jgi:hypothetical protein
MPSKEKPSRLMDEDQRKQQFSFAYIRAVASHAGYGVDPYTVDDDSIDLIISSRGNKRPRIEVQVKCTSQEVLGENSLKYPLIIKNYNDLIVECVIPRYLVILVVPKNLDDWIVHSENALSLRHCAYWQSLTNLAEVVNTSKVTVEIPKTNLFDSTALHSIMEKASNLGKK